MWIVTKITMIKGMKKINNKLLEIIYEYKKDENKNHIKEFNNNIVIENISFSYNNETKALDDISINFEKNKKYAIVGKSGSGKSTVLKLLLGYYDDFEGNIKFDNNNYRDLSKNSINQQMSVIHQDVYMFDETIKKNILLGKSFNDKELKNAINKSGVNEFLYELKDGLNYHIGENGSNLSGGQKQRVAIARSLIQNTPILLLDEGTSALDTKTAFDIEDKLLEIDTLTVITVTHKLIKEILNRYDEIIVMDKGRIIEKGSFKQLVENKGEFYNLYKVAKEKVESF